MICSVRIGLDLIGSDLIGSDRAQALFDIKAAHPAALAGHYAGFVTPLSYAQSLDLVARSLPFPFRPPPARSLSI